MACRPRGIRTDKENLFFKKKKRKEKKKRQQYIKCFFFNETNPKDVQFRLKLCSSQAWRKQTNKRNKFRTVGANPGQGWICHQGGFFGMALGPAPLGWAQGQRAQASPHSAPGWPASLCPHFHECHLLPSGLRSLQSWLQKSSFSEVQTTQNLLYHH